MAMDVKTEAIVLKSIDYKENDKMLTLFSPSLGKISAGIRGVKKPTSKLNFAAQPFCFAEYILAEKGGRYTVTNAYLHEAFYGLRLDIVRFYAACSAMDVCRMLAMENESAHRSFVGLLNCLKELSLGEGDSAEALIRFLLDTLGECGYPIDLGYLEDCDGDVGERLFFDFSDGKFVSEERAEVGRQVSLSTYHVLRKCADLPYDEDVTAGGRKRALRLLKVYLCEKTEESFENFSEFIRLYDE